VKSANTDGAQRHFQRGIGFGKNVGNYSLGHRTKECGKERSANKKFCREPLVMNVKVGRAVLSAPGDARRAVNGDWNVGAAR
jgi:hypothetical protein